MDLIQATFTASNTIRDKNPYTIYEIEVRSSSTITWVIYKRYSEFATLHAELTRVLPKHVQLPNVPPKRLTRSLASEFVEKRKEKLQKFMTELLRIPQVVRAEPTLRFLDVPASVRPMILRGTASAQDLEKEEEGEGARQNFSQEDKRVMDLVEALEHHSSKVAAIKAFENFFFDLEKPKRLQLQTILALLQGPDGHGGLLDTCGRFSYSSVAARAALELLCRLLDIERNQDAASFLDAFVHIDAKTLLKLNLDRHINEDGSHAAFQTAAILSEHILMDKLIVDPTARQTFFNWMNRKNLHAMPYTSDSKESFLKSPTLQDVEYKAVGAFVGVCLKP